MDIGRISGDESFYFNRAEGHKTPGSTRHYHNLMEIYYMKDGECHYFIDNKVYEVKKGDIVLIPEGVIHKTIYGKTPHTRLLINCSAKYVPTSVSAHIPKLIYLYRNEHAQREIDEIFAKVEAEWNSPDEFSSEVIRTHVYSLLFTMVRNNNKFAGKNSGNILVEECVKYVQDNFMHNITLSSVARLHSVSMEHLSRTFKKETGFGFNEFVTLVRLQRAEAMLKNENGKSVSAIAYACGFNDSNYFSDKFKKTYGVSPSKVKRGDIS